MSCRYKAVLHHHDVSHPLVVAGAPVVEGDAPFHGTPGARMAKLAGAKTFEDVFVGTHLLPKAQRHGVLPPKKARKAAKALTLELQDYPLVLLAGPQVAKAFRVDAPYFEPVTLGRGYAGPVIIVIPDPTEGPWWLDPRNAAFAKGWFHGIRLRYDGYIP